MEIEVISRAALLARAGSPAAARRWVRDGDWWRVCRDAYAPRTVADSPLTRLAALRHRLPPDVAISHQTALWLHGVPLDPAVVEVTVERGRHLQPRPGLRPHSALLPDAELCLVAGVLVVSPARALVDLARSATLEEAVVAADATMRLGLVTAAGLQDAAARASGLRHVVAAREVLRHVEPRTESAMETRYRLLLVRGGLPRPLAQYDVYDADGHAGRGDFYLEGVILEFDGREQRLQRSAFVRDRQRQNRIADTGLEIRRFTSFDVYCRPATAVCAEVRRALRVAEGRDRGGLCRGPDTLPRPRRCPPPTLADRPRPP